MALQSNVNNVSGANGGAEFFFGLKALLVACGWIVKASGGGTGSGLFSAVADVIDTVAKMNVSRAWYRIQAPGTMVPVREFCIMRGSGGNPNWWIKVSAEDKFTGGAADEDDMPTATDEQNVWGTAVAGTALFSAAATYKFHLLADDAAPFAFCGFSLINGTGAGDGAFLFLPLETGTYPAGDDDPAIYYADKSTSIFTSGNLNPVGSSPQGWYKKDLAGEAWVRFPALLYYHSASGTGFDRGMGTNPIDGTDETIPIAFGRPSGLLTQVGWKGFGSSFVRWNGTARSNGDTLSVAGVKDKIIVGGCAIRWPDTVPVL